MSNSRLVYSTDGGDRRRDEPERPEPAGASDGIVRVARERSGRGKPLTVVRGLPPGDTHQSLFPLITTRSGLNCKCIKCRASCSG